MDEKVPEVIKDLAERFEKNLSSYKSQGYNEARLREEFVNPFFEALGWDIYNKSGTSPAYCDVIHEDAIKMGGGVKAPDYCFTLSGKKMFFVETKKPSVDVTKDIHPAYQLRRYSWSAHLPLSILTNFENLAIYESRQRPKEGDKINIERTLLINYNDYIEKWDEIASIFSKKAVLQGSFDRYIESEKKKRGTQEVDDEFLKEIEGWRETLASNIAIRNAHLSVPELNDVVQKTIDRIIFLRMCEDRGIEQYGQLLSLLERENIYPHLCKIYEKADEKYNSGLFHFKKERDRSTPPDEITLKLTIDDKVLKDIIKHIYYPESPYEFSVLRPEILGNVYEQFLGKVIRLTEGHRAKVEEKPEVKKTGGVYYTPEYIVGYIVKNTVGKLCEGKTPKQIEKMHILDPACGSGSFLLGAYSYLLKYCLDYYTGRKNPKSYKEQIYQRKDEQWVLTIKEKKRILLNNIFGVDIDSQAVEVTKLSLLLKVLEGESKDIYEKQQKLWRERVLPDLGDNIKCGNSLISSDIYDSVETQLFDNGEMYRINAFDWKTEFKDIMDNGGFDAVIGNPPYVDIKGLPKKDVEYIFKKYPSANNRINLFAAFIERSLSLLNSQSFRFSMIVPTALLSQKSYFTLRRKIIDNFQIKSLVRLPNESFGAAAGDVKVDTVIFVINQRETASSKVKIIGYAGYDRISEINPSIAQVNESVRQSSWAKSPDCVWSINTKEDDLTIINKCERNSIPLEDCAEFSLGLTPYDKYKGHTPEQINNKVFHSHFKKDKTFKKLLAGNDVMRYFIRWNGKEWISYGPWLGASREQRFFTEKRILVKQIIDWTSKRIWASITEEELYNTQNAFNLIPKKGWSYEYLLGILNSNLMTFFHRKKYLDEFKMRFQKILIKDCRRLPIYKIDLSNPNHKNQHDRMVKLVRSIIDNTKKIMDVKSSNEKQILQRQIDATDQQIDQLVYELYGLTKEEIQIVEESVK